MIPLLAPIGMLMGGGPGGMLKGMLDTLKNGCECLGKLLKGDLPGAMKEFGETMQSAMKSMGGMGGGLPGLQLPGQGDDLLMKLLGLDGKKTGGSEGASGEGGGQQGGNPLQSLMQGLTSIIQGLAGLLGGGKG